MRYESFGYSDMQFMSPMYVRAALFVGAYLHTSWSDKSDSHHRSEYIKSNYFPSSWTSGMSYLYDTGSSFSGGADYEADKYNVSEQIENGYHFVHVLCHGGYNCWQLENKSYYTSSMAASQRRKEPYIIVTGACNTNAFDQNKSLGESFVRESDGCIAYYGNSRSGWNIVNTTASSLSSTQKINAYFFKYVFNGTPSGAAYSYAGVASAAKSNFVGSANTDTNPYRWDMFARNALGDAELPLYSDFPHVVFPTVTTSGTSLSVSTSSSANMTLTSFYDCGDTYFQTYSNQTNRTFSNIVKPSLLVVSGHNVMLDVSLIGDFAIVGDTYVYDQASYYVSNLPSGISVSWSYGDGTYNASNPTIQIDNDNPNLCTLNNSHHINTNKYLTAKLKLGGFIVKTLTRQIYTCDSGIAGSYTQEDCTSGGLFYDGYEDYDIEMNSEMYVNPECLVSVQCPRFQYYHVSHSGITPTSWYYNGSNSITFSLPASANGQSFYITLTSGATVRQFQFVVDSPYIQTMMSYEVGNQGIEISIPQNANSDSWSLEVYNVQNGRRACHEKSIDGQTYFLPTTKLTSGRYVIRVMRGNNVYSRMIYIK